MHATSAQATALTDLSNLAAEMAALGFQPTLNNPPDGLPCLVVRNPQARALTETVHAREGRFWWSWREPITPCDQPVAGRGLSS